MSTGCCACTGVAGEFGVRLCCDLVILLIVVVAGDDDGGAANAGPAASTDLRDLVLLVVVDDDDDDDINVGRAAATGARCSWRATCSLLCTRTGAAARPFFFDGGSRCVLGR